MPTMLARLYWSLCFLLAVVAARDELPAQTVHIHHRTRVLGEDTPFTPKGTVQLTPDGPSYAPAERSRDELTAWASLARSPHALYEVALETEGSPGEWPRSSVKLCYVTAANAERLTLHNTLAGDVFGVDYHLSSVPRDGACPSESTPLFIASTHVVLKPLDPAHSPRLKTPPPLASDGQPVTPIVEKSFIQKYWMYIVPGLIILLVLPAGPEEGAQQ